MLVTIILALIIFTVLVLGHELGHFLAAKFFGLRIDEFGFGFPPRLVGKRKGETLISFNLIPFGGFVKIYGENPAEPTPGDKKSFQNLTPLKRGVVIASGVFMNLLLGYFALTGVHLVGIPPLLLVSEVLPGSPGSLAGLKLGDEILGFEKGTDFLAFLSENGGKEIGLEVRRKGEKLTIKAVPKSEVKPGEGRLGVVINEGGVPKEGLPTALVDGMKTTYQISKLILFSLVGLFIGIFQADFSNLNNVSGPVGIFGILGTASRMGMPYVLQLVGLISLNLAILNLLPIPALDGGRLFFIIIEKIIGRPVHYKSEAAAHTFGFILLIILMTIITLRDIIRIL